MGPFAKESRKIGPFIYFLLKKKGGGGGGPIIYLAVLIKGAIRMHLRTMPYIGSYPHPHPFGDQTVQMRYFQ